MKKLLSFLLTTFLFLFLFVSPSKAFPKKSFLTLSFSVRGEEKWQLKDQSFIDFPFLAYEEVKHFDIPITWLLRFDVLNDDQSVHFFNTIISGNQKQELGALFEITPQLVNAAGANYQSSGNFNSANHIFLSGYSPQDRKKLIDTYMDIFYQKFNFYPQLISSDHLDAFSLDYLTNHYSTTVALVAGETFESANLRHWGGSFSSFMIPSKNNILVPAQNSENRINVAIAYQNPVDILNNFFPLQNSKAPLYHSFEKINENSSLPPVKVFSPDIDQLSNLTSLHFDKTFNELNHLNINLENDYFVGADKASEIALRNKLKKFYQAVEEETSLHHDLYIVSLKDFGKTILSRHPITQTSSYYQFKDSDRGIAGIVSFYQNPFYRLAFWSKDGKSKILDFRVYHPQEAEDNLHTANVDPVAYSETPAIVDSIKYPEKTINLGIPLEEFKITTDYWNLSFKKENQEVRFEPQRIVFDQVTPVQIDHPDIKVITRKNQVIWEFSPQTPFVSSAKEIFISLFKLFLLIIFPILLYRRFKSEDKKKKLPSLPIILGILFAVPSLLTVVRSGKFFDFGIGFWGPNGHDAIFHLSLINSLKEKLFSLSHPQFAGELLKNYHLGVDLLASLVSKLTGFSPADILLRVLPIAIVISLVYLLVKLLLSWGFGNFKITLSLFFAFLAGSLGFIPRFFADGQIFAGESAFWANQSVSLLLNPPFALSLVFLLWFLLLFQNYQKKKSTQKLILLALVGGLLAQIKVYAFILLSLALLLTGQFLPLIGVGLVGVLISLPTLGLSGSPFVLNPLWFPKSMFAAHDRLNWPRLVEAWQTYEATGVWIKLFLINLFALTIFILGNLGIRLIGLVEIVIHMPKKITQKLVIIMIFSGILIPLIITQASNPWNTIQFLYYSLFFLSIFTAKKVLPWFKNCKSFKYTLLGGFILLLLTLPTTVGTLKDYLTPLSSSRISAIELHALSALKDQPQGVVVSPLFNNYAKRIPAPKPLYAYTSTAYISAYASQTEYLSDTINLEITGFDYRRRANQVQKLYQTTNVDWVKDFLKDEKISYVYENPLGSLKINHKKACLTPLFTSGEIRIYKYLCSR